MRVLNMKLKFKNLILFVLFFLSFSSIFSQNKPIQNKAKLAAIKISGGLTTGSGGMSQYMLNRLSLGGYMSHENIHKSDHNLQANSRAGFNANGTISFIFDSTATYNRISKRPYLYKISIDYLNYAGSSFSQGAFRAVFLGNTDFIGQQLELKTKVLQMSTSQINAAWKWKLKQGQLTFGAGFGQLHAYRNLNVKNGFLRTDSALQYVDVKINGDLLAANYGYGITTELQWAFNNKIKRDFQIHNLGLSNLGVYSAPFLNHFSKTMDSGARIHQATITINSLNRNTWITDQRDTFNNAFRPDSAQQSKLIYTPFQVFAEFGLYKYKLLFKYIHIPGYLPSLTIHYKPFLYKKIQATPALQLGGWDTWNINLGIANAPKSNPKANLDWMVNFYGLEAFAFPKSTHGAGVIVGLKYNVAHEKDYTK